MKCPFCDLELKGSNSFNNHFRKGNKHPEVLKLIVEESKKLFYQNITTPKATEFIKNKYKLPCFEIISIWRKEFPNEYFARSRKYRSLSKLGELNPMKRQEVVDKCVKNNWYNDERRENICKRISESKLINPTKYWLGKKRPEMMLLEDWNHTDKSWEEIMGEEKANEYRKNAHDRMKNGQAREMRLKQKPTKFPQAELIFKKYLEDNNINFISQYRYKLGLADFYLPDNNLIIQCYGSYWHSLPNYIERDKKQNQWLDDNGYNVLIFCSEDIVDNKDNLKEFINLDFNNIGVKSNALH